MKEISGSSGASSRHTAAIHQAKTCKVMRKISQSTREDLQEQKSKNMEDILQPCHILNRHVGSLRSAGLCIETFCILPVTLG